MKLCFRSNSEGGLILCYFLGNFLNIRKRRGQVLEKQWVLALLAAALGVVLFWFEGLVPSADS